MPLGIAAAVWRDSWVDTSARAVSLIGVSAPTFWLAFIMLAMFYGGLQIARPGRAGWIPSPSRQTEVTGLLLVDSVLAGDWETFHDAAAHLVLPSIVLAAATLGPDHPHHPRRDAGGAGRRTMCGSPAPRGCAERADRRCAMPCPTR